MKQKEQQTITRMKAERPGGEEEAIAAAVQEEATAH